MIQKTNIMKKTNFLLILLAFATNIAFAQEPNYDSCTSIMVTKTASTDGSVMTSHTCDSNYRTWMNIEGSKEYKLGEMDAIYWGTMHNEEPWDKRGVVLKGEIPAPKAPTFSFLNTSYPCLNEKQLAMGETTTVGNTKLVNKKGLFVIEELERIALQRCSTARDAIVLMGQLAETYGYGDYGECLTIADKKEVWHFEIYGSGPGKPSALWAAQRIPEGHVGVSANIPRIGAIDFKDKDNFLYSTDIRERSKELGYWDGKKPFKFYPVVASRKGAKNFSIREFFIFNELAPSMNLSYDMEELPFSVVPEEKVSAERVMSFLRETYEGTEYDPTKDLTAVYRKDTIKPVSAFMHAHTRALLNELKPDAAKYVRTIAVIQCAYSHVIQLRDWLPDAVGGVAYVSIDNPAQSPRFPIYSGTTTLPESFNICAQHRYRPESAAWAFRETNRISTINWDKTRGVLEPEQMRLQKKMLAENAAMEAQAVKLIEEGKEAEAQKLINEHTADFANTCINKWKELKADVWQFFLRSM